MQLAGFERPVLAAVEQVVGRTEPDSGAFAGSSDSAEVASYQALALLALGLASEPVAASWTSAVEPENLEASSSAGFEEHRVVAESCPELDSALRSLK